MKKLFIRLLTAVLCALMTVTNVGALEPSYAVSDLYKNGGYYDRLCSYELTGDPRYDVLSIALTQLGYHEGDSDADMDGLNIDGDRNFVEYNRLYGKVDNKEGNGVSYGYAWCASFVTWCLRQARVSYTQAVNSISCSGMTDWYVRNKIFYPSEGDYTPLPGDIIMFSPNDDPSHVGLVLGVVEDEVYTVEGNNGGIVGIHSYELTDDYILGYCVPKYVKVDNPKDCTPLLTENINKTGLFIINAKSLNVRSDASNDSEVIGALKKYDEVTVTERSGNWGKIDFEGAEGWIYMPHTTDADYMVYTLKYDLNGGEGKEYQRKLKGGKITVTDQKPTKKGYAFVGWADTKDTSEPNVKAGDVYTEDKDITLYAIWKEAKYTVTYYNDDGSVIQSFECQHNDFVPTVEDPVKDIDGEYKYKFTGWTPQLVQVVVKDLVYTATYEKIALTEEEKAQFEADKENSADTAQKDKDKGSNNTSYTLYIIIGAVAAVVVIGLAVLVIMKKKKA